MTKYVILIVDDFQSLLLILPKIFEGDGYATIAVSSGYEALEQLQQSRVDVILSDIEMPEMNGFELLREVRAMGVEAPFVFLSGNLDKYDSADLNAADAFLHKPLSIDEMLSVVNNLVSKGAT